LALAKVLHLGSFPELPAVPGRFCLSVSQEVPKYVKSLSVSSCYQPGWPRTKRRSAVLDINL